MTICGGCKQAELLTGEQVCLRCVEDLSEWLRAIPLLFEELGKVRLPGSVRVSGPYAKQSVTGSVAPVRLAVVDLLDRGETLRRLWAVGGTGWSVADVCAGMLRNIFTICSEDSAAAVYRAVKALVRDLGRTVGEPEEQSVGKCSQPITDDGELCRGALFRADIGGVYCKRCGHKPEIKDQAVWCTIRDAALITGKPVETIRTWYKRRLVGANCPTSRQLTKGRVWLPIVVRRAAIHIPTTSASVNHGTGAEPSAATDLQGQGAEGSGSDADVLGWGGSSNAPGNVTPPVVATAGTAVVPVPPSSDPLERDSEQGKSHRLQYGGSETQ